MLIVLFLSFLLFMFCLVLIAGCVWLFALLGFVIRVACLVGVCGSDYFYVFDALFARLLFGYYC